MPQTMRGLKSTSKESISTDLLKKVRDGDIAELETVHCTTGKGQEAIGFVKDGTPYLYHLDVGERPTNKTFLAEGERFHDQEAKYDQQLFLRRQRLHGVAELTKKNGWFPKKNPQKKILFQCFHCGAYTEGLMKIFTPCPCR